MDQNVQELVNRIKVDDQASSGFLSARDAARAFMDQVEQGGQAVQRVSATTKTANDSLTQNVEQNNQTQMASNQQMIRLYAERARAHEISVAQEKAAVEALANTTVTMTAKEAEAQIRLTQISAEEYAKQAAAHRAMVEKISIDGEQLFKVFGRQADLLKSAFFVGGVTAAIVSVVELFKNAVREADTYENAMARIGNAMRNQHADFDSAKKSIEDFADALSRGTPFGTNDILSQLGDLVAKGHDVSDSMNVISVATNVAIAQGKDLGTVVNALALAWQGNNLGLRQLGINMNELRDPTKGFNDFLHELYDRSRNATQNGITPLKTATAELHAAWQNLQKDLGESATGPIATIEKQLIRVVDALDDAVKASGKAQSSWDAFVESMSKGKGPLTDIVTQLSNINKQGDLLADWLNKAQQESQGNGAWFHWLWSQFDRADQAVSTWMYQGVHGQGGPGPLGMNYGANQGAPLAAPGVGAYAGGFAEASLVMNTATAAGIDPALFGRLIDAEGGGFTHFQVSTTGAVGPGQIEPATAGDLAKTLGVTVQAIMTDPATNLRASAEYLRELLTYYHGNRTKAVAAYNAGQGAVDEYGGVPPFPQTQAYVARILGPGATSGGDGFRGVQHGGGTSNLNASKVAAQDLRAELEKITEKSIPDQIKALEALLATHTLTADQRTRITHTLYEDEQKLSKEQAAQRKKDLAEIAKDERERFSESGKGYTQEARAHKDNVEQLQHVVREWENLGATIRATGDQARKERADIHAHIAELNAEIAKLQEAEPSVSGGFIGGTGTVNGDPYGQSILTGQVGSRGKPAPSLLQDLAGATAAPLLKEEVQTTKDLLQAKKDVIQEEGGLKSVQDARSLAVIQQLRTELQLQRDIDNAILGRMTPKDAGYTELKQAVASADAELRQLTTDQENSTKQMVKDLQAEAAAAQKAYDAWADRAEAAIQRLVFNSKGQFKSLADDFKDALKQMEEALIKSALFKLLFPASTKGQESWATIFQGAIAAPFGGLAPGSSGAGPKVNADGSINVVVQNAGADFLNATTGSPAGIPGIIEPQSILPAGLGGGGGASRGLFGFSPAILSGLGIAAGGIGMGQALDSKLGGGAAGGIGGGILGALGAGVGLNVALGGGMGLLGTGGLFPMLAANPLLFGGVMLAGALLATAGPHWGPPSNYPDRSMPGYGQMEANWQGTNNNVANGVSYNASQPYNVNQGGTPLYKQMETWANENKNNLASLTDSQKQLLNQLLALEGGNPNADLGVTKLHNGQWTLANGQTVSVAQASQMAQTFGQMGQNGLGAPGTWTISRSYPDFNVGTLVPGNPYIAKPSTGSPTTTQPVGHQPEGGNAPTRGLPGRINGPGGGTITVELDADALTRIILQRAQAQNGGYGFYSASAQQRSNLV